MGNQIGRPGESGSGYPGALPLAALDVFAEAVLVTGPHLTGTGPTIRFANSALCVLAGFESAELVGRPAARLVGPGIDGTGIRRLYRRLRRTGRCRTVAPVRRSDGTMLAAEWEIVAIPDQDGGIGGWMSTLWSVRQAGDDPAGGSGQEPSSGEPAGQASGQVADQMSGRVSGRVSEQAMLQTIPHLVWQSWDHGYWYASSPQWNDFTGQNSTVSYDRGWLARIHPEDRLHTLEAWKEAVDHGVFGVDHRIRRHDGVYRWFQTRALPMDRAGTAEDRRQWVGTSTDVDELHQAQARISYLAYHDVLTGLGNRAMLTERLDRLLSDAEAREPSPFNVLFLDVDDFKRVNDRFGVQVADRVLREVGSRLTRAVSAADLVVRMGGDEFVVLQRGAAPEDGMVLADRLREAVAAGFRIDQHVVRIDVSVGIACRPRDGDRAEPLLKRADLARGDAKSAGHGQARFFRQGLEAALQERLALQTGLAEALDRGELTLAYQPVLAASTGVLCGYEALVRWQHAGRGTIPPGVFIPIAEETGLIVRLGEWVLRRACLDAASDAFGGSSVAVNLSPVQFRTGDLAGTVTGTLAATGLPPERLVLEITERLLMDDSDSVDRTLRTLKAASVRIALDDFGTGYSNFGYLCRFPFDQLKIDRSFVASLGQDEGTRAVVSGIVALAHDLGISVTAEGVETEIQRDMLRGIGCDRLQGYLLGRPMPIEAWTPAPAAGQAG